LDDKRSSADPKHAVTMHGKKPGSLKLCRYNLRSRDSPIKKV
jgi:hypothetical protein